MKLKSKIFMSMGMVFVLFSVAIGVALTGMQSNKNRFERFLEQDLALAQAATSLYAQGLQMGQALRNIVIEPTNQAGFKNIEKAAGEFKADSQKALSLAASNPSDRKILEQVAALREQQIPIQSKIVGLASTDQAAAIAAISQEETPVWRKIREHLVDFIKAKQASVENTKAEMVAFSQRMLMITLALLLVAVIAAAAIVFWLVRHIMKQLGGEPAYAVEVAQAISSGDFSRAITVERGDSSSLLFSINAMRETLTGTIGDIRHATETIAVASREIGRAHV